MKLSAFTTYILCLALGVFQVYSTFRNHFSGLKDALRQVQSLEKELGRERLKTELAVHQTLELRQSVAQVLPDYFKKSQDFEQTYSLRNLASVVRAAPAQPLHVETGSSLFDGGRTLFREGKFSQASELFSELIEKHPNSIHVVNALFLSLECAYQLRDQSSVARLSATMMVRHPEHVLTGFALIRLARVYGENDRRDDAVEVLQAILRSYSEKELVAQAQSLLKEVEL